jgi:hypothetical protein
MISDVGPLTDVDRLGDQSSLTWCGLSTMLGDKLT